MSMRRYQTSTWHEIGVTGTHRVLDALHDYPLLDDLRDRIEDCGPSDFEHLRTARLRHALDRAVRLPFYQRLWRDIDFHPSEFDHCDQLKELPTFDVDDVRSSLEAAPPWGLHQSTHTHTSRIQTSGGTTGMPRPVKYTQWDRTIGDIMHARCLEAHGTNGSDVVANTFSYGLHNAAIAFDSAVQHYIGATIVPLSTGNVTPSKKQVELITEYGVTHIVGSADYLVHLARLAGTLGIDVQGLDVQRLTTIGDWQAAEEAWGRPAMSCYGTFEVQMCATECTARNGWHLWEDAYHAWIADTELNGPIPDGRVGNLVITSFWSEGFPVINMNTRDMTCRDPRVACACGVPFAKLSGFHGRSDTMVKVRGINVWPEAIGAQLAEELQRHVEYFVVAIREAGRDELVAFLETVPGDPPSSALESALRVALGVLIQVRPVSSGSLAPHTRRDDSSKSVRFADHRKSNPAQALARYPSP